MRSFAILAAAAFMLSGCQTVVQAFSDPVANAGPCPSALSLYDAHRIVELQGGEVRYENIGFTGEILGVRSLCTYSGENPIIANLELDMAFGRGPAAQGESHTYQYFVAVTRRDIAVIEKQVFPVTVRFRAGQDRVYMTETIDAISIPRLNADTSGVNFEILTGFELTDEQLAFNRTGQRFRVGAGQD
ncbi:hypothetical protein [uncultured Maricaulis sp.]|uniref:hypothetical protein n=1 Tax=uncultured Maricaulis sp. TaxID=174710 RepID=UPI0030DDCACF|tara:strand:+ start:40409 stop:40972 length:564 start_codon:yes stop_codon:yes gene_type:complete